MFEYKREWDIKNRDRLNAQARARYARDPQRAMDTSRRWQKRNAEKIREGDRRRYSEDPAKFRIRDNLRRARIATVQSIPFTPEQLQQKFAYYGNRCYLCGGDAEAMDHVKPIARGGPHMLANLRPACKSCNSRKGARWPYVNEALLNG